MIPFAHSELFPDPVPLSYHSTSHLGVLLGLFLFVNPSRPVLLPTYSGALHWSMVDLPGCGLRENSLSPNSCQCPVTTQLGWDFLPHSPPHAWTWCGLGLPGSGASSQNCSEFTLAHTSACCAVSRGQFPYSHPLPRAPLLPSPTLLKCKRGCDPDVQLRAEHPAISHSKRSGQL